MRGKPSNYELISKQTRAYPAIDDPPIVGSEEVCPGIAADFDGRNEVVGIEIFHLSKRSESLNLGELVFETT